MKLIPSMLLVVSSAALAQNAKKEPMPYTTVDHPQFIAATEATFLSNDDVLVGISHGDVAKAYPAADLAQHGVVQDQMADGPIAITW
jgi:hypothetical protein